MTVFTQQQGVTLLKLSDTDTSVINNSNNSYDDLDSV